MKAKFIILISLFIFKNSFLSAQKFTILGDKAIGTIQNENQLSLIYVNNYQFIVGCSTQANINGDKTDPNCDSTLGDIWLFKMDTAFNMLWDKSYGGSLDEVPPRLNWNSNANQVIFSDCSGSDSTCEKSENNRSFPFQGSDYWICLLDSNGNIIWDKTYGGNQSEVGAQIIRLGYGDYVLAGSSFSDSISGDKTVPNYSVKTDYWVIKIDSSGNKIWDKVFGGTGYELSNDVSDYGLFLIPEPGNNFILKRKQTQKYAYSTVTLFARFLG